MIKSHNSGGSGSFGGNLAGKTPAEWHLLIFTLF